MLPLSTLKSCSLEDTESSLGSVSFLFTGVAPSGKLIMLTSGDSKFAAWLTYKQT